MKKTFIFSLLFIFLTANLSAKVLLSPIDAMKENYGKSVTISKKNILLSNEDFKKVQAEAKTKLTTKIYRIYTAKKDGKILGYGILINKKVRSKNGVVMYLISDGTLKGIEIIAFNEPHEYIPSKTWQEQFRDIKTNKMLQLSRDIPTITGATLSARSVTDSSRIAFAIYNKLLKGK
ncbi:MULTISPECIES: FMN-binding protein [Sulfurimonas]|uniref:FMN-binding protein n=1 Tax=Sulfurimonas TaxID=202746 RepID=UPI0012653BE0|nr:FMN-binding protein [Sulfurimonas indica]